MFLWYVCTWCCNGRILVSLTQRFLLSNLWAAEQCRTLWKHWGAAPSPVEEASQCCCFEKGFSALTHFVFAMVKGLEGKDLPLGHPVLSRIIVLWIFLVCVFISMGLTQDLGMRLGESPIDRQQNHPQSVAAYLCFIGPWVTALRPLTQDFHKRIWQVSVSSNQDLLSGCPCIWAVLAFSCF